MHCWTGAGVSRRRHCRAARLGAQKGVLRRRAGLTQWGHVFTVKARKHLDDAAADGKAVDDVRAAVEGLWAQVRPAVFPRSTAV